jgi:DNA polymerase-4
MAIERELLAQARRVAGRLVAAGLRGRVVTVKLRYANFETRSRQHALPEPVHDTDSIFEAARALLPKFPGLRRGVRLTGISVGELTDTTTPTSLFPDEHRQRREKLEAATRLLEGRGATITRASLLERSRPGRVDDPRRQSPKE